MDIKQHFLSYLKGKIDYYPAVTCEKLIAKIDDASEFQMRSNRGNWVYVAASLSLQIAKNYNYEPTIYFSKFKR